MLEIKCPWCGKRDQTEFSAHGEAHIARPLNTEKLSDEQWGDYVFFRTNPKGLHFERWVHAFGCRRWFNALRNTATDEIHVTYKPSEKAPTVVDGKIVSIGGGGDGSAVDETGNERGGDQ